MRSDFLISDSVAKAMATATQTRNCAQCGRNRPLSAYSKKQWRKALSSRCKNCVAGIFLAPALAPLPRSKRTRNPRKKATAPPAPRNDQPAASFHADRASKPRKIVKARRDLISPKQQAQESTVPSIDPDCRPMPLDVISRYIAPCLPVGAELTNLCIAVGPEDAENVKCAWLRTHGEEYLKYSLGLYTTYPFLRPDRKEKCRLNIQGWMDANQDWRDRCRTDGDADDEYRDPVSSVAMENWRAELLEFRSHAVAPTAASLFPAQNNPSLSNLEEFYDLCPTLKDSTDWKLAGLQDGCALAAVSVSEDAFCPCTYDFSCDGIMHLKFGDPDEMAILRFYRHPDMLVFSNPLVALDIGLWGVVGFLIEEKGVGVTSKHWRGLLPEEAEDRVDVSLFEYAIEQDGVSVALFETLIGHPSISANADASTYSTLLRAACAHLYDVSMAETFKKRECYLCVARKVQVLLDLGADPLLGDNGQVFGPNNPFANVRKWAQEHEGRNLAKLWQKLADQMDGGLCFSVKL